VAVVLALGLAVRCYHYARNPSVWHDEAALIVNVLDKGFRDLLGPLSFGEAGPPLFLWAERAVALALGDGTYLVRLVPLLASCLALVLFVPLARRTLPREAVPWALLLFACSNRVLWHTCEAKPYAVDVLAATVVPTLAVLLRGKSLRTQCAVYTLAAPCLVFASYPGSFVLGGLLVALLPAVCRARRPGAWAGYGLLAGVVAGCFGLLILGPAHAQRCAAMTRCWKTQFPDWHRPWAVPAWSLFSGLDVVRYCLEPTGQALALVGLCGAICLWRRGQRRQMTLLTLPAALGLLASYVGGYPWGGCRVDVFLTPATALLVGGGVPPAWRWLRARTLAGALGFAAVVAAPVGLTVYRTAVYWPRADAAGAAAYVLAHRRAPEGVTANHWEYYYYFRRLGPAFTPVETLAVPPPRLWVVLNRDPDPRKPRDPAALIPGGRILDHREFVNASVYLLARR
jgi:hypothetical protein